MELAAFSAKHECDRVVAMHIVGATPVSYVMVCSYAQPSGCNPLSPPPPPDTPRHDIPPSHGTSAFLLGRHPAGGRHSGTEVRGGWHCSTLQLWRNVTARWPAQENATRPDSIRQRHINTVTR